MTHILGKIKINNVSTILKRYKSRKEHWSVAAKKNKPSDKALKHFDDFYGPIYGESWQHIRAAMLTESNKDIAIVNNFADPDAICENLSLLGAMDMKALYEAHAQNYADRNARRGGKLITNKVHRTNQPIEGLLQDKRRSEVESIFPEEYGVPEGMAAEKQDNDDLDEDGLPKVKVSLDPVQLRPLEEDLENTKIDIDRVIKPSIGLTASSIYEYIPATKLKGLDDYVLESDHYGHYAKGADFVPRIENEAILNFPEHLKIYTFDGGDNSTFPSPTKGLTGVYDYFLMDGISILPILALDLRLGDTILDMCAAPGEKSLAILQTLFPRMLVSNDVSRSKVKQINRIFEEYLGDFGSWEKILFLTNVDARIIEDEHIYNKILISVPCTNDRDNLHDDDDNIFSPSRIKERLLLPELQTEILIQALKILAPGGTVVYSTCSLSPIQNDGVVQMAMKKYWEETKSVTIVKNMDAALGPLRNIYKFASDCGLKYGHVVIPTKKNNWGPMYFCKIMKMP